MTAHPTAERLREIVSYDGDSGVFVYIVRAARRSRPGDVAGSVNSEGYRTIRIDGRGYKAHRLAWLYVHGKPPEEVIDHINGNRDDNRIANLRTASHGLNMANTKPMRAGKSLPKGVGFNKHQQRWTARIQRDGRPVFLGYFDSPELAADAYRAAARTTFGEFARTL